jgi:hypothetical protein
LSYDSANEGAVTRLNDRENRRFDKAKNSGTGKPTREQQDKRKMTTMAPYHDAVSAHGESLSPVAQAQIGRGLKAIFDDIAREPIPDDLLRLLKELETRDEEKTK